MYIVLEGGPDDGRPIRVPDGTTVFRLPVPHTLVSMQELPSAPYTVLEFEPTEFTVFAGLHYCRLFATRKRKHESWIAAMGELGRIIDDMDDYSW